MLAIYGLIVRCIHIYSSDSVRATPYVAVAAADAPAAAAAAAAAAGGGVVVVVLLLLVVVVVVVVVGAATDHRRQCSCANQARGANSRGSQQAPFLKRKGCPTD